MLLQSLKQSLVLQDNNKLSVNTKQRIFYLSTFTSLCTHFHYENSITLSYFFILLQKDLV